MIVIHLLFYQLTVQTLKHQLSNFYQCNFINWPGIAIYSGKELMELGIREICEPLLNVVLMIC